jgi:hypothetical protein
MVIPFCISLELTFASKALSLLLRTRRDNKEHCILQFEIGPLKYTKKVGKFIW